MTGLERFIEAKKGGITAPEPMGADAPASWRAAPWQDAFPRPRRSRVGIVLLL